MVFDTRSGHLRHPELCRRFHRRGVSPGNVVRGLAKAGMDAAQLGLPACVVRAVLHDRRLWLAGLGGCWTCRLASVEPLCGPPDCERRMVVSFFGMKRLDWAMIEVVCLWLMIAALIASFSQFSTAAALLLAPYLAWVSVAAALNFRLLQLNGARGLASDR